VHRLVWEVVREGSVIDLTLADRLCSEKEEAISEDLVLWLGL